MNNSESLQEKVIRDSLITLFLTLLGTIFAYLIRILYSHTLSVESYGLFYAAFNSFNILIGFGDLGFGYATIYLLPKYLKVKEYQVAWNIFIYGQILSFVTTAIISLILALSAPFLAKYYFKVPGSESLIYILCIYLITVTILSGLIQIFTGMQEVKYYSAIALSKWLLTFVFSILFFLFDFHEIIFYAYAWALGYLATSAIFLFLFLRKHAYLVRNKISWNGFLFKRMLSLAYPVFLEHLVYTGVVFAETFLLTLIRGVKEVGIYNIVYPLAMVPLMLLSPINSLILPLISHLMEGEREKVSYLINQILAVAFYIGTYFSLFLVIFPSVAGIIFGQKWFGLVETPLTILSMGSIGYLMSDILGTITIGTGKVTARLKANTILAIVSVGLDILLIWKYGVLGLVITNSLVKLILTAWCLLIIKSTISLRVPVRLYLKIFFIAIISFIVIRFSGFAPRTWFELIVSGAVYTILFIFIGFYLKIYDKKLIMMIIPRIRK